MKKQICLIISMVLMAAVVYGAVFEIENESYKVLVTMINYEPDPVAPGNTVDVRFKIENYRDEPLKNVEVKVEAKNPFSHYYSTEHTKTVGTLAPLQIGNNAARVKFKLLVSRNAAEGENEVEFWYRVDGGAWIKGGDFYIDVRERDAVLAINEINTNPESITPGKKASVNFKLENLASSVLKDIKLNLELYKSVTLSTAISTSELPFTPVGSGNEKTLKMISPGKSEEISFDLFVDAEADSKMYKIPYTLSYADESGANFTRGGIIGMMVDAEPDVSINIESTDIYSAGAKGTVDIRIVNKGFSDVKFVDLMLKETQNFEILSNPEVYIGNIDSDDYESAEYSILVDSMASGEIDLPLKVEYRNANGRLYTEDKNLKLELFAGEELSQRTNGGGNSSVGIIIIVVIVVVGILSWRWWKKRKKNKKV
jgi:hypothetical protein